MTDEILEAIKALQKQLEEAGYTIYALRPNDDQPTLVMYNTKMKHFVIIAFSPDTPGVFSQTTVWLTLAESKAEILGSIAVSSYKVFKRSGGTWTVESIDNASKKVQS